MSNNVIGIDFGTSNSCVSYFNTDSKKVEVILNNEGNSTSPTMIYFSKDSKEILYGDIVKNLLNSSNNGEYLENIFTNIKRLIGISYSNFINDNNLKQCFNRNVILDKDDKIMFQITYNNEICIFYVEDIIKLYLNYLKTIIFQSVKNLDISSIQCCLTVPAYFNDTQREIIKKCAEDVNFRVLRILNEPTSAALCYAFQNENKIQNKEDEYIIVIDCGGGTTDVSLLHLDYIESIYEVKNTAGDNFLGGEDITNEISLLIQSKLNLKVMTPKILSKIKIQSESIKKQFAFNNKMPVKCIFEFGESDTIIEITYTQFEELTKDFFRKIKNLIYYVLDSYMTINPKFTFSQINNFIFVGGSTRILYFQTIFKDLFGKDILIQNVDPDYSISIGASFQGALINDLISIEDGGDTLLLDVIPLTIGIETIGGLMTPIISRNSMIPISRSREFLNSTSFEESIIINVFQGERKFIIDNQLLTSFELNSKLFNEFDKGEILIKIIFEIDCNSIITAKASAKINETNVESIIKITKEQVCISSKNLEDILFNSETNKLLDSELASKTLMKLELYDSFKYLLSVFHEKRDTIINEENSLLENELNKLFNNTFEIINTFKEYSFDELKKTKESFETKFHSIIFAGPLIFKDSDGLIIKKGGSIID